MFSYNMVNKVQQSRPYNCTTYKAYKFSNLQIFSPFLSPLFCSLTRNHLDPEKWKMCTNSTKHCFGGVPKLLAQICTWTENTVQLHAARVEAAGMCLVVFSCFLSSVLVFFCTRSKLNICLHGVQHLVRLGRRAKPSTKTLAQYMHNTRFGRLYLYVLCWLSVFDYFLHSLCISEGHWFCSPVDVFVSSYLLIISFGFALHIVGFEPLKLGDLLLRSFWGGFHAL